MGDDWRTIVVPPVQRVGRPSLRTRLLSDIPGDTDALVTTSTPLPFDAGRYCLLPIVYDTSWYWYGSAMYKLYRSRDLLRSARRAAEILTISASSQAQIEALTRHQVPTYAVPMGPGQFEGYDSTPVKDTHTILLMGKAPHKANELAAHLLGQSRLVQTDFRVIAIWVSTTTANTLREGIPSSHLEIRGAMSRDELAAVFTEADRYIALGYSEGFGFPYVEAAYFGCDVIAPRTALTTEVMGEDGNYLAVRNPSVQALEAAIQSWDPVRVGQMQDSATQRTWKATAESVAQRVRAKFTEPC